MKGSKPKLYTAGATVGLAAVTVGLMVVNEMESAPAAGQAAPAPVASAGLAAAPDATPAPDPAPMRVALAAAMPTAVPPGLPMPAPATAPAEMVTRAALPGDIPALPREPEIARAAFDLSAPVAAALRDRLASLATPSAPVLPSSGPPQTVMAAADTAPTALPAPDESRIRRNAFGIPCGAMLSGAEAAGGMVALTLTAPCRSGEVVTVAIGELSFTATINSLGTLKADVPALAEQSEVSVRFADGSAESLSLETPAALGYERVALQWQGADSGLQIHALEFGADYGETGHVWAGAPRGPEYAVAGRGGYLTRLGDGAGETPRLAEVYTFPIGVSDRDGVVRLSVEAEITQANCDTDVAGQSLQPALGGGLQVVELSFAMPGCDAVGEFLVLKNVLRDLRVAAN